MEGCPLGGCSDIGGCNMLCVKSLWGAMMTSRLVMALPLCKKRVPGDRSFSLNCGMNGGMPRGGGGGHGRAR